MINETLIDTPPQLWRTSELVDNARRYVDGADERTPDRLFLALNTLTLVLARTGRTAQASELLDRGIQAADRLMREDADAIRFGVECVINHARPPAVLRSAAPRDRAPAGGARAVQRPAARS